MSAEEELGAFKIMSLRRARQTAATFAVISVVTLIIVAYVIVKDEYYIEQSEIRNKEIRELEERLAKCKSEALKVK